jgi:hypothetical protein
MTDTFQPRDFVNSLDRQLAQDDNWYILMSRDSWIEAAEGENVRWVRWKNWKNEQVCFLQNEAQKNLTMLEEQEESEKQLGNPL